MLPDRVSNQGPLTYLSGALPIALCGPAQNMGTLQPNYNVLKFQTLMSEIRQHFFVEKM